MTVKISAIEDGKKILAWGDPEYIPTVKVEGLSQISGKAVDQSGYFPTVVTGDYTNGDNVKALDGAFATIPGAANVTAELIAKDFDFSNIPVTDAILELTIRVRENADVPGYITRQIQILKGETVVTQHDTGILGSGFDTRLFSVISTGTWTVEDLQAGLLSVRVASNGGPMGAGYTHRVDAIYIEVEHAAA